MVYFKNKTTTTTTTTTIQYVDESKCCDLGDNKKNCGLMAKHTMYALENEDSCSNPAFKNKTNCENNGDIWETPYASYPNEWWYTGGNRTRETMLTNVNNLCFQICENKRNLSRDEVKEDISKVIGAGRCSDPSNETKEECTGNNNTSNTWKGTSKSKCIVNEGTHVSVRIDMTKEECESGQKMGLL